MSKIKLLNKNPNSANYNSKADWNDQDGNVTTVGSNGGPSAYGTYDMSGNVWDWTDMNGTPDSVRVIRGGSWRYGAPDLSSAGRFSNAPSHKLDIIGFRLSSSLNPLSLSNFVVVDDANNVADTNGYGSVSANYLIGKYSVTNCEYIAFLNAVDPEGTNPQNIYDANMNTNVRGGITFVSGNANGSKYVTKTNMSNKPVIWVSWFDAARYCNWLHNGALTYNTTNDAANARNSGAYNVGTANTGNAVVKNSGANYSIPTENEWYKAAYYTPNKNGSGPGYWLYATQSDSPPTPVTADSSGNGIIPASVVSPKTRTNSSTNSANYNQPAGSTLGLTNVGTNGGPSYYGTYDQFGLAAQWTSTPSNSLPGSSSPDNWILFFSGTTTTPVTSYFYDTFYIPGTTIVFREARLAPGIIYGERFGQSARICSDNNFNNIPDMVLVANINNPADTQIRTPFPTVVSYEYYIGKYPITVKNYLDFLNSVASTDIYECYNDCIDNNQNNPLIVRNGSPGSYTYSTDINNYNLPFNLKYSNLARYCNWLHNNKPIGNQNTNTTEGGAYVLNNMYSNQTHYFIYPSTTPTNDNNLMPLPVRESGAKYWIPTASEWYKAACYDPTLKNGTGWYWSLPTRSNTLPRRITNKKNNNDAIMYKFSVSAAAAPISVSPLHLANGFLSSLRSDTISEAEYPNAALANGYLSVLRVNDTISESEYPNAALANGYLSTLHTDTI